MKKILYIILSLLLLTSCGFKKQEVNNKDNKKIEQMESSTLGGGNGIPNNESGKR